MAFAAIIFQTVRNRTASYLLYTASRYTERKTFINVTSNGGISCVIKYFQKSIINITKESTPYLDRKVPQQTILNPNFLSKKFLVFILSSVVLAYVLFLSILHSMQGFLIYSGTKMGSIKF